MRTFYTHGKKQKIKLKFHIKFLGEQSVKYLKIYQNQQSKIR